MANHKIESRIFQGVLRELKNRFSLLKELDPHKEIFFKMKTRDGVFLDMRDEWDKFSPELDDKLTTVIPEIEITEDQLNKMNYFTNLLREFYFYRGSENDVGFMRACDIYLRLYYDETGLVNPKELFENAFDKP